METDLDDLLNDWRMRKLASPRERDDMSACQKSGEFLDCVLMSEWRASFTAGKSWNWRREAHSAGSIHCILESPKSVYFITRHNEIYAKTRETFADRRLVAIFADEGSDAE